MFSSQRREPAKKQKIAAISRIVGGGGATSDGDVGPRAAAAAPSGNTPRPTVKVATVTRTVQVPVKRVVASPMAPPVSRPSPVPPLMMKRKAELDRPRSAPPVLKKSRKADSPRISRPPIGLEGEGGTRNGNSAKGSSSDEELTPKPRKRDRTPFVERNVAAELDGNVECITGEQLVLRNRAMYSDFFCDPADTTKTTSEWAGADIPSVVLEYPGILASERLLLLAPPKGEEEYDPIEDVMESIRLVLDFFLTPDQAQATFSHTPSTTSFSAFLSEPPSRSSTPTIGGDAPSFPPLMRQLEKAKAKRDGPGFLAAVERFNAGLRSLKADGTIKQNIQAMKGIHNKVWMKVVAQVYERVVGPEIEALRKYEAFSDNVYGELLPRFMSEIFQQTGLGPASVFVDLGSGVGNCVVQAALATGCEAWGFENMAHASSLARRQIVEAEARFRMWGIKGGAMKTVEADFCQCAEVNEVIGRADVVLVNNEVFSSALNQRLSLLFLDLPSNARIVSLKAFASSFTLSAYNQDSPLAILNQGSELRYGRKSVSWKDEGGTYFIARVDRTKLEKFLRAEEKRRRSALAAA